MKNKLRVIGALALVVLLSCPCWASLPRSGNVDGVFGLRWEKPHVKSGRLYLTLTNDNDLFQPLQATVMMNDKDGKTVGKAVFDVGISPKSSLRVYGVLEKAGDLDTVESLRWVIK